MVSHPKTPDDARLKVLVSSSMLHQYWLPKNGTLYEGDTSHVDQITIPGARIEDLRLAFRYDYYSQPRGMDVVLVAEYQDQF